MCTQNFGLYTIYIKNRATRRYSGFSGFGFGCDFISGFGFVCDFISVGVKSFCWNDPEFWKEVGAITGNGFWKFNKEFS